jgi:hypothetical protein
MNFIFMVAPERRFLADEDGVDELFTVLDADKVVAFAAEVEFLGDSDGGGRLWPGVVAVPFGWLLPGFHMLFSTKTGSDLSVNGCGSGRSVRTRVW